MKFPAISRFSGNKDGKVKMEILREKTNSLLARRSDILQELENAEIQPGNKRRAEVANWLVTVERKIDELGNLESHAEGITPNYGRIETLTEEVKELVQQDTFPQGLVLHDHEGTRLPLVVSKLHGEAFGLNTEIIVKWLKSSQNHVFGVYGMGGVGKTTLLKHIYNQLLKNSRIFGRVYWVTVSNNCSLYRLQDQIAHQVQLQLPEEDELKRASLLHHGLAKLGRVVFILDDSWDHYELAHVGIPLGENNCKIILTTRKLELCRKIGCNDSIIKVENLSKVEAWNLFVDRLQNYETLTKEVKQIAKLVGDECHCLPLAIIVVAGSMRGVTDKREWQDLLDELKNPNRSPPSSTIALPSLPT